MAVAYHINSRFRASAVLCALAQRLRWGYYCCSHRPYIEPRCTCPVFSAAARTEGVEGWNLIHGGGSRCNVYCSVEKGIIVCRSFEAERNYGERRETLITCVRVCSRRGWRRTTTSAVGGWGGVDTRRGSLGIDANVASGCWG